MYTNEVTIDIKGVAKGVMHVGTQKQRLTTVPIALDGDEQLLKAKINPSEAMSALYFTYEGEGYLNFMQFILH